MDRSSEFLVKFVSIKMGILLLTGFFFGCGSPAIKLPYALESSPETTQTRDGHFTQPLGKLVQNRALGRSGYACVDCHTIGNAAPLTIRPAPALVLGSGGPDQQSRVRDGARFCIARYLMRNPIGGQQLGDLARGLMVTGVQRRKSEATNGRVLYEKACAHCHERGPAPPLLGRPFQKTVLLARIRGDHGPARPTRLMPGFARTFLSDHEVGQIIQFMLYDALPE